MRTAGRAFLPAALLVVVVLWSLRAVRAAERGATVTVTDTVIARGVEPIGANLTTIAGGTNLAVNNHVWNSGFEPISWRRMTRVERAGADWFEWDSHGGPGYWNLAWTGLGNGATVRFYRIVDRDGRPLAYGGGRDMNDTRGADRVVFLGEARVPMPGPERPEGGYVVNDGRDGDAGNDMARVYIDRGDLRLRFGDYAYLHHRTLHIGPETSPPDLREHYTGARPFFDSGGTDWHGRLVPHPEPVPEAFVDRGDSCLYAVFPEDGPITLQQYVYHAHDQGEGQWYSQLTPGAAYRVSVWMRQQGLGNSGRVRFVFNHADPGYRAASQPEPWQVNDTWQHFVYDFTAPAYPAEVTHHIAHGLEFTGPGEVWIDSFVLHRHDAEHEHRPFTPHRVSFDEFMRSVPATGRKPAIRFYGTIFHPSSIRAMFTDYSDTAWNVAWNMGPDKASSMTIAQSLAWAYRTGDSPETRAVPYLTCIEEYTEDEWKALVEYLGVPYDPEHDTAASRPYAYLRTQYRDGNGTPWTDEFREIVVEYGNETWHNGAGGYGWEGWGPPGYVHHGGEEYGLFARYMFDENVMQMPEWAAYDLGDKIRFALGGNYEADPDFETAYAEEAVRQGPTVAYVGHANYVGPKWETADASPAAFTDAGIQETLISRVTGIGNVLRDAARTRDQLRAQGIRYDLIAYEGGPSGYWQNKDNPIIDELYGKSAAMGLAALDAWLYSSSLGFRYQCYLGMASGKWWSSHTMPEAGGFRPHAGWLALQLRNRYAPGDRMLEVQVEGSPEIRRGRETIPALAVYAIQAPESLAVFLLNRSLTQGIPVILRLPERPTGTCTLHRLTGPDGEPVDPRAHNLDTLRVRITSLELPVPDSRELAVDADSGATPAGLPPGAVYLYVFPR